MPETNVLVQLLPGGVPIAAFRDQAGNIVQMTSLVDAQGNGSDVVGAAGTGISEPTGGTGIIGFLSGIYRALTAPPSVTPAGGTVTQVSTGGTAVTVATGPIRGGYVINPPDASAQGVTLENLYLDPVGTPGSTDGAANGTTHMLTPGDRFDIPPLATG